MTALAKAHKSAPCRAIKAKRRKLELELKKLGRLYKSKLAAAMKKSSKKRGTGKRKKTVKRRRR